MIQVFPEPIRNLPEADIPFEGCQAYLSQSKDHQIIFMEFGQEVVVREHAHAAQFAIVLEGRIDLVIGGKKGTYTRGDRYYIPEGVPHSARIYPGYVDMTFFNQPSRYKTK